MVGADTFGINLKFRCLLPLVAGLNAPVNVVVSRQEKFQEAHPLVLAGLMQAQKHQVVTKSSFGHLPVRNFSVACIVL